MSYEKLPSFSFDRKEYRKMLTALKVRKGWKMNRITGAKKGLVSSLSKANDGYNDYYASMDWWFHDYNSGGARLVAGLLGTVATLFTTLMAVKGDIPAGLAFAWGAGLSSPFGFLATNYLNTLHLPDPDTVLPNLMKLRKDMITILQGEDPFVNFADNWDKFLIHEGRWGEFTSLEVRSAAHSIDLSMKLREKVIGVLNKKKTDPVQSELEKAVLEYLKQLPPEQMIDLITDHSDGKFKFESEEQDKTLPPKKSLKSNKNNGAQNSPS